MATLTLTDTEQYNGGGQATLNGIAIGTAAADRIVIVAVNGTNNSNPLGGALPSSVTLGGVSMNLAVGQAFNDPLNNGEFAGIYWLAVPTGTTATIVATWGATGNVYDAQFAVYSATGLDTTTPVLATSTGPTGSSGAGSHTLNLNVAAGGVLVGVFKVSLSKPPYPQASVARVALGLAIHSWFSEDIGWGPGPGIPGPLSQAGQSTR